MRRGKATRGEADTGRSGIHPLLAVTAALICLLVGLAAGLFFRDTGEAPASAPARGDESTRRPRAALAPRSRRARPRPPAPRPKPPAPAPTLSARAAAPPRPAPAASPSPPPPASPSDSASAAPTPAAASEPPSPLEETPPEKPMVWSLDKEGIQGAVREAVPHIRECYDAWLKMYPKMEGGVRVKFTINARERTPEEQEADGEDGPVGAVLAAKIDDSQLEFPLMEGCIVSSLKELRFEAPESGELNVTYPFRFSKGDDSE